MQVVEPFLAGKSQSQIALPYSNGMTQVRSFEEVLATYRDSLQCGVAAGAGWNGEGGQVRSQVMAGMLHPKALQLAPQLGYSNFKASNGWLATFKANHSLKFSCPGHPTLPPATSPQQYNTDGNNLASPTCTGLSRTPPWPLWRRGRPKGPAAVLPQLTPTTRMIPALLD